MKEKMINTRVEVHKTTAEMVALRLPYEEMVCNAFMIMLDLCGS